MKTLHLPRCSRPSRAFSLLELIAAVTLIAIIASVAVVAMSSGKTAVQSAKLKSDVAKLNEIVSVYLANGGSLTGLTTPQAVIDKLKTTVSADDARRNVGVMTGRGVDIRLTANMQTAGDAATGAPRVTWDGTKQAFVYSSSPGAIGVSAFALNDSLASGVPATETRTKSAKLYNGSNGWVWGAGSYTPFTPLGPANVPLTDMSNLYNPAGGSSGGSGSGPYTLPVPIISPVGGIYPLTIYPSLIYINPNGAADGSSVLKYSLNNGPWMVYTGPFSVASGTTVTARNFSTNASAYLSGVSSVQSYYFLVPAFTGMVTAHWNSSDGPSGKVVTISNGNPDSVVEQDGTAASGYTRNSFTFARTASFNSVPPNAQFSIGQLSYLNGTINSGTGSTGLHLHLDITMSSPSVATTGADINMALNNTTNSGNAASSADICTLSNPVTNYNIVLNGLTYTLHVMYGAIDVSQGFVDTNNTALHVYEGATGVVPIIATFATSAP